MSDVERRLRDLLEEIAPRPDLGRLLASGRQARRAVRWVAPVAAGVAIALGFAVAVVISRTEEPTTTTVPVVTTTTTVSTTTTTLAATTTTQAALPTVPASPAERPTAS